MRDDKKYCTHHSAGHFLVVVGIGQGQMLEHVIVRGQGQCSPVALEHCLGNEKIGDTYCILSAIEI